MRSNDYLEEFARSKLRPGERVKWSGRPVASAFALPHVGGALFSVFYLAILAFVVSMGWRDVFSGSLPFVLAIGLFMAALAALGLWMLVAPLYYFLKARRRAYFVTTQRVIIMDGFPRSAIMEFDANKLGTIKVDEVAGFFGGPFDVDAPFFHRSYNPRNPYSVRSVSFASDLVGGSFVAISDFKTAAQQLQNLKDNPPLNDRPGELVTFYLDSLGNRLVATCFCGGIGVVFIALSLLNWLGLVAVNGSYGDVDAVEVVGTCFGVLILSVAARFVVWEPYLIEVSPAGDIRFKKVFGHKRINARDILSVVMAERAVAGENESGVKMQVNHVGGKIDVPEFEEQDEFLALLARLNPNASIDPTLIRK